MLKRILAIDFGSCSIKVGEFQIHQNGDLFLLNCGIEPLHFEQHEKRFAVILDALKLLLKRKNIRPAPATIALSATNFYPIKLPPTQSDQVFKMAMFEARQYFPFPVEEAIWDYFLTKQGESPEALLMALERDSLEEIAALLNHLKIPLLAVDVAPLALQCAFQYNYPDSQGCSLILDIGEKRTHIVFAEKENFFYQESYIAGHLLTKNIARELHESYEAAETLKKTKAALEDDSSQQESIALQVSEIARSAFSRLHLDLSKAIHLAESLEDFSERKTMFLTGGTSLFPGIKDFLRKKTQMTVDVLNPLKRIGMNASLTQEKVEEFLPHWAVIVGLALRAARGQKVNLLPPSVKKIMAEKKRRPWLVGALVLWALAWTMPIGANIYLETQTIRQLKQQKQIFDERHTYLQTLEALNQDLKKKEAYLQHLSVWQKKRTRWMQIFNVVHQAIPENIWIAHWEENSEKLLLRGYVEVQENALARVEDFRRALQSSELFQAVIFEEAEIISVGQKDSPVGLSFVLKISLNQP
ncbi:MAG: pilus assembly protein PilM [Verrucomicrobiota bacterium]